MQTAKFLATVRGSNLLFGRRDRQRCFRPRPEPGGRFRSSTRYVSRLKPDDGPRRKLLTSNVSPRAPGNAPKRRHMACRLYLCEKAKHGRIERLALEVWAILSHHSPLTTHHSPLTTSIAFVTYSPFKRRNASLRR